MKTAFQFDTLAEFVEYFKDEETCRKHFAAIRFAPFPIWQNHSLLPT